MKNTKTIITLVLFLTITSTISLCTNYFFPSHNNGRYMPNNEKIEDVLVRDIEELTYVGTCFLNLKYDYIRLDRFEDTISYSKKENNSFLTIDREISDVKLKQNINYLKEKNYSHIIKSANYVMFVYWENLDSSLSIVYCPIGTPEIERGKYSKIFEIKQMSKKQWFYCKNID